MAASFQLETYADRAGAAVSHLAELVRGKFSARKQHPLIRPVSPKASLRLDGPPSPQGEKGKNAPHFTTVANAAMASAAAVRLPLRVKPDAPRGPRS